MKNVALFLLTLFGFTAVDAQFIYKIKADSVLITNDSCTAELIIENSTKSVKGFLVNKGNGRTEFRRAQKLTDSSFIIAGDTILIKGVGINQAWKLRGNANTDTVNNFLGTTDSLPLIFRTNNIEKLRVAPTGNIGIGSSFPSAFLHIKAGSAIPGTAPLKFTSGSLLTTAEVGAMEFSGDKYYGTITTGAARKEFTLNEATLISGGAIPYTGTNGRLLSNANLKWNNSNSQLIVQSTQSGSSAFTSFYLLPTWNTSGLPVAFLIDVNDITSHSKSVIAAASVNGNEVWAINKVGNENLAGKLGVGFATSTVATGKVVVV